MVFKMTKKNFNIFFLILSIFSIDRLTKYWILNKLNSGMDISVTSFLSFNLIRNEGIAFGLFSFNQKIYYNSLTIFIFIIVMVIFWMIIKSSGLEKIGLSLVFGGALGNLFDRIFYSSVPDFIDIHFGNFHWFIFNVADIFITLGVIILIYSEILLKKKHEI